MNIKTLEIGFIGTNCYVISDDNGVCAIIDCDGNPAPLFQYIADNGLHPTHILLTHGHFDHIGAVEAVQQKYGCKICLPAGTAGIDRSGRKLFPAKRSSHCHPSGYLGGRRRYHRCWRSALSGTLYTRTYRRQRLFLTGRQHLLRRHLVPRLLRAYRLDHRRLGNHPAFPSAPAESAWRLPCISRSRSRHHAGNRTPYQPLPITPKAPLGAFIL